MSRITYVNGRYLPHHMAHVHVDDRAHTFSDGVYEVILAVGGLLVDEAAHMTRLARSLRELGMPAPMSDRALRHIMHQTIARNRISEGMVYLQVNRGTAPRNHVYDSAALTPTVVCTARTVALPRDSGEVPGVSVVTRPDNRWQRVDIKTTSLLPNVMARTAAADEGAYEAWLVDDEGLVTECSSSNAWIVDQDGRIVTRPLGTGILAGITRRRVMELAASRGIEVVEQPFSVEAARNAREAFLTSTTSLVRPVTRIDDAVIGNGHPGATTCTLLDAYLEFARTPAPEGPGGHGGADFT